MQEVQGNLSLLADQLWSRLAEDAILNQGRLPSRLAASWRVGYGGVRSRSGPPPAELMQEIRLLGQADPPQQQSATEDARPRMSQLLCASGMALLQSGVGLGPGATGLNLTRLVIGASYDADKPEADQRPISSFLAAGPPAAAATLPPPARATVPQKRSVLEVIKQTSAPAAPQSVRQEVERLKEIVSGGGNSTPPSDDPDYVLALKLQREELAAAGQGSTATLGPKRRKGPLDTYFTRARS